MISPTRSGPKGSSRTEFSRVVQSSTCFEFIEYKAERVKLNLDIRHDPVRGAYLYFPFMSCSDVHWGTSQSRAKPLTRVLQHTETARLQLPGDITDIQYMKKKSSWNCGPWQRQGKAEVFRKADHGTEVIINPGNHENDLKFGTKSLEGQSIYGVKFERQSVYKDPAGRSVLISHGHEHDADLVHSPEKRAFLYNLGDWALNGLYVIDRAARRVRPETDFSFAATGKHTVKNFINDFLGVRKRIHQKIDASPYDAYLYGHTHMGGFERTPHGKLIMNDGTCTEHVQFIVHDAEGHWALLRFHKDRMLVTELGDDGKEIHETIYWTNFGLEHFGHEPKQIEDEYTFRADKVLRLLARAAPAIDYAQAHAQKRRVETLLKVYHPEDAIEQFNLWAAMKNPLLENPVPRPVRKKPDDQQQLKPAELTI